MNIQSLLKEKNIYFPLKYHGASDFATRWNVKTLIDNQELFRKVISNVKQECLQKGNKRVYTKTIGRGQAV